MVEEEESKKDSKTDFIFLERSEESRKLVSQVARLERDVLLGFHAIRIQEYFYRVFGSFCLMVTPALAGCIIHFHSSSVRLSPTSLIFRDSLVTLLLSFGMCVGLPLFAMAVQELSKVRQYTNNYLTRQMDDISDDEDDNEASQVEEEKEDTTDGGSLLIEESFASVHD